MLIKIISYRFIVVNFIFVAYVFFIEEQVLESLIRLVNEHKTNYFFGFLFLTIQFFELYALSIRRHILASYYFFSDKRINTSNDIDYSQPNFIVIWVFHTLVSVILSMNAMGFLGYDITAGDSSNSLLPALILFLTVIKEIVVLVFLMSIEKKDVKKISHVKELIVDFILILYASFAFTGTWVITISTGKPGLGGHNIGISILYSIISFLIFLMFYLPINMSYMIEDFSFKKKQLQKYILIFSIFIAGMVSLLPLYKIPVDVDINLYNSNRKTR